MAFQQKWPFKDFGHCLRSLGAQVLTDTIFDKVGPFVRQAGSLSNLLGFDVVLESWDITNVPTSDGANATLTTTTMSTTFTYSTTSSTIDPNSTTADASAMTGRRLFNLSWLSTLLRCMISCCLQQSPIWFAASTVVCAGDCQASRKLLSMKVKQAGEWYPLSLLFLLASSQKLKTPVSNLQMFASQTVQDADTSWPAKEEIEEVEAGG